MRFDKRLFLQVRGVRAFLVSTVALSTFMGVLIIVQAHYLTAIINNVFLAYQTLQQVWYILLLFLGIILLRTVLVWGSGLAAHQVAAHVKTTLRKRLFEHLFALGPAFTRGERSGELINTTVEGVEALDAYFSQYVPQLFLTVFVPVIVLIAVFSVDTLSGLVLLITAPLLPFLMALVGLMANAETKRQWRLLSLMSAHFLDVLQGLTTLKLFGRNKAQVETIRRVSDRFRQATMSMLRIAFLSSLVLEMGATVSTAIVAVEAGLRLLYGNMSFTSAFFVLLLAPEFYLPLRQLGTRYHAGMSGAEAAQRIFAILETPVGSHIVETDDHKEPPVPTGQEANVIANGRPQGSPPHYPSSPVPTGQETDDHKGPRSPSRPAPIPTGVGVIRFEDVHYTYDGQRPALNGVSFHLYSGQKVALVGPSGAGKSTIAQLLLRFIEANSGSIRVDGRALQEFVAQEWRKQVAWVPQHPYLFNATVAENIRLGCPEATMQEVRAAAQQAYAAEFIEALPQGYDTRIGERAIRLSGGEAQRISLARAFLKNAPLLILDEATSSLDPEHEAKIVAALKHLMQGRTVLIIAHRLSTVYDADQIVVLDAGRVVEVGTHHMLVQHAGMYRQLVDVYRRRSA